jgi:hypothetical protein
MQSNPTAALPDGRTMSPNLEIFFHDRCFDGLASASLFAAFHQERFGTDAIAFHGLSHEPGGGLSEARLRAPENAVVDFAYLPSPKLTWWFDHHRSAFEGAGDEAHFRADRSGRKFYDPMAPSCTGLVARTLQEAFDFDPSPHADLIEWAEIIDSAAFESPDAAVTLSAPALELMLWIERSERHADRVEVIERLRVGGIAAARAHPVVEATLPALLDAHRAEADLIARECQREGRVVFCDLTGHSLDAINKFVPYQRYPEAAYAVVFSRNDRTAKISVGYNAWHDPAARDHDISVLCKREGGGGHPYVGAITRRLDGIDELRAIARRLVETLNDAPST